MTANNQEFIAGLRKARELLTRGWTRRALARTASGDDVMPKDPAACEWCLWGALNAAGVQELGMSIELEGRPLGLLSLGRWNDSHTQADALACIDNSIAALEAA